MPREHDVAVKVTRAHFNALICFTIFIHTCYHLIPQVESFKANPKSPTFSNDQLLQGHILLKHNENQHRRFLSKGKKGKKSKGKAKKKGKSKSNKRKKTKENKKKLKNGNAFTPTNRRQRTDLNDGQQNIFVRPTPRPTGTNYGSDNSRQNNAPTKGASASNDDWTPSPSSSTTKASFVGEEEHPTISPTKAETYSLSDDETSLRPSSSSYTYSTTPPTSATQETKLSIEPTESSQPTTTPSPTNQIPRETRSPSTIFTAKPTRFTIIPSPSSPASAVPSINLAYSVAPSRKLSMPTAKPDTSPTAIGPGPTVSKTPELSTSPVTQTLPPSVTPSPLPSTIPSLDKNPVPTRLTIPPTPFPTQERGSFATFIPTTSPAKQTLKPTTQGASPTTEQTPIPTTEAATLPTIYPLDDRQSSPSPTATNPQSPPTQQQLPNPNPTPSRTPIPTPVSSDEEFTDIPGVNQTLNPVVNKTQNPTKSPSLLPSILPTELGTVLFPSYAPSSPYTTGNSLTPTPRDEVGPLQQCVVSQSGSFGNITDDGVEFEYFYQVETFAGLTGQIVNGLLPSIEHEIGVKLLPQLFPQLCLEVAKRRKRRLQVVGYSSQPPDAVLAGIGCVGEPLVAESSCFVIDGGGALFLTDDSDAEIVQQEALRTIKETMDKGTYDDINSLVFRIRFRNNTNFERTPMSNSQGKGGDEMIGSKLAWLWAVVGVTGALVIGYAVLRVCRRRRAARDDPNHAIPYNVLGASDVGNQSQNDLSTLTECDFILDASLPATTATQRITLADDVSYSSRSEVVV